MLRTGLRPCSRDRLSDRRAQYAFCPQCLGSTASARPPHLPVEWACAVVTHCPTHRTRLQERCPVCYVDDPFFVGVLAQAGRATCWQCDALLSEPLWRVDRALGVDATMQLQAALLSAMRGHAPAWPGAGPLTAGGLVGVVEDLVTLLIGSDTGDPAFMRVAAVHWPADLGVIRAHHRPSRVAAFPVAWRYIVMALAASVLIDPPLSSATIPVGAHAIHQHPMHTLVASLTDLEWRRWEDRMTSWPGLVRATLQGARRVVVRCGQISAGIPPN
jgi:TniQ